MAHPAPPLPGAFRAPPVAALSDQARLFLRSVRLWALMSSRGRCPAPVAAAMMGGAASAFARLMHAVADAWPEPFTCLAPCAPCLSPDEALLAGVLTAAVQDHPADAEALLADFAAPPDRERLWALAGAVAAGLAGG